MGATKSEIKKKFKIALLFRNIEVYERVMKRYSGLRNRLTVVTMPELSDEQFKAITEV